MNKDLKKLLKNVPDTYPDFEADVLNSCKADEAVAEKVIKYLKNNPKANTGDILEYLTSIEDLPDIEIVDD